ncbi:MAG: ABC transporter ATP-binding protein [Planctomycetes bacterium]|nr:ABC transporter ATP-binding protein [Planctomycetota bacterium]
MSLVIDSMSVWHGARTAVQGVSVSAPPGQTVAVIGRNGSGKSSLVRAIAGIHAGRCSGSVVWKGRELSTCSAADRARCIAYVAQRPLVAADFTAREVIGLAGAVVARSTEQLERAIDALAVHDLMDRPFAALSGGEQQRVVLARALAQHDVGGLLVLDEPFNAMDLAEQHRVAGALQCLAGAGSLVLIVLHDLVLADALAHTVWWMEAGRLRASGPRASVLSEAALGAGFGVAFERVGGSLRPIVAPRCTPSAG